MEIRLWLRKVERHHHAKNIPKFQWGDLAFSFLEQKPEMHITVLPQILLECRSERFRENDLWQQQSR